VGDDSDMGHHEHAMTEPRLRVRCACGWEVVGTEDEIVPATQEHGRRTHNMSATRDEVLAMTTSVPDVGDTPAVAGEGGASRP
jgi:predicted small metal-binding protein